MDNYSIIVITVGLRCHHKDFHVYGHQDEVENQGGTFDDRHLHFVGTFSKFAEVESEPIDGYNRWAFRPVVSGFSPYVFVKVNRIPETATWRICEVEFT